MKEKEKILQLLKSDDHNNRKLGFILAKGLKYDLVELLIKITNMTNEEYYCKSYRINDYIFYLFTDNKSAVWNGITDNYTWIDYKNRCNDATYVKDCKKLFIKLILEDE